MQMFNRSTCDKYKLYLPLKKVESDCLRFVGNRYSLAHNRRKYNPNICLVKIRNPDHLFENRIGVIEKYVNVKDESVMFFVGVPFSYNKVCFITLGT